MGDEKAQIIRISEPIKKSWAEKLNLNLTELLSDGPYKEKYRKEMIVWSDEMRAKDYGFFCREACKNISKEICIVSDIRRKGDIKYFKETFGDKIKTIRITTSDETRIERGWKFQEGVDDIESECGLDDHNEWDLQIQNENDSNLEEIVNKLTNLLFI